MRRRYQLARYGNGFAGRGALWPRPVLRKLRRRLRRIDGPYTIGHDSRTYTRPEVIRKLRSRLTKAKPPAKYVVHGSNYDEPAWAVRVYERDDTPPPDPMIPYAERFIGRTTYLLGGSGPPGPTDCSGLTMDCARTQHGVLLPHLSEGQRVSTHMRLFHDAGELRSGDFIFYHFTSRNGTGAADHVALFVRTGVEIGSRPSTRGVDYHAIDVGYVIAYGRLKT